MCEVRVMIKRSVNGLRVYNYDMEIALYTGVLQIFENYY